MTHVFRYAKTGTGKRWRTAFCDGYEFYEFSGDYDAETHEAGFALGFGDSNPGPNDVGTYLGSPTAAANLETGIPEPQTYAIMLAALALIGAVARTRNLGYTSDC